MLKKRRKFQLDKKILILALLILIIAVSWLMAKYWVVKVVQVKLSNVNCVDEEGVKSELGLRDKNMLLVNFNNLENKLKSKYICIKKSNFTKQLPDKLLIDVNGRIGTAVVGVSSGSAEFYLVDDEGIVFSKTERIGLPFILVTNLDLDKNLLAKAVRILQKIEEINLTVNEAIVDSNQTMLINSDPKLQFNLNQDIEVKLASLQLILDKAKIDNEKMDFIDLRFEKPVVKFTPKEKK